jgi:hypothetical protein
MEEVGFNHSRTEPPCLKMWAKMSLWECGTASQPVEKEPNGHPLDSCLRGNDGKRRNLPCCHPREGGDPRLPPISNGLIGIPSRNRAPWHVPKGHFEKSRFQRWERGVARPVAAGGRSHSWKGGTVSPARSETSRPCQGLGSFVSFRMTDGRGHEL